MMCLVSEMKLIEKVEAVVKSVETFEQSVCARQYLLLAEKFISEPSSVTRFERCMKALHKISIDIAIKSSKVEQALRLWSTKRGVKWEF